MYIYICSHISLWDTNRGTRQKKHTGNDTLQPKFCRINERQIWTWFGLAPETYQANIFIRQ